MIDSSNPVKMFMEDKDVLGILIYPVTNEGLPQDIIFLPLYDKKDISQEENLSQLLVSSINANKNLIPIIYFQGLKWRNENLSSDLSSSLLDSAIISESKPKYFGKDVKVLLSIGTITFNQSRNDSLKPQVPDLIEINMQYKDSTYSFSITDDISFIGFPILFKPFYAAGGVE